MFYVGIIDGKSGAWGVRIPDVPGAYGAGPTIEDAVRDATQGLSLVAADMRTDGEAVPRPRELAKLLAEAKRDGGPIDATVMIPLLIDKSRSVRANISLDAGLLEAIDAEAKRRGLTRSSFMAGAAKEKISDQV